MLSTGGMLEYAASTPAAARRRSWRPRSGCCTRCARPRRTSSSSPPTSAPSCGYMKMITLPKLRDCAARHAARGAGPPRDRRARARARSSAWSPSLDAGPPRRSTWTLITPDNHYVSRLAVLQRASVVKLVTPRLRPARFGQYLVQMSARRRHGGRSVRGRGALPLRARGAADGRLRAGARAPGAGRLRLPASRRHDVLPRAAQRHRRARALAQAPVRTGRGLPVPRARVRQPRATSRSRTPRRTGVRRRELLPVDDPARDFAMSILQFDAGCGLPQVEIHDEEHGLWMTAGGGTYHLDGEDLPGASATTSSTWRRTARSRSWPGPRAASTCSTRTPGATGSDSSKTPVMRCR